MSIATLEIQTPTEKHLIRQALQQFAADMGQQGYQLPSCFPAVIEASFQLSDVAMDLIARLDGKHPVPAART